MPLRLNGRAMNGVSGGHYHGSLEFLPSPFSGLAVVNVASLDDYVKGVVPGEMPSSWAPAALEAQAVAARSYALATDAGGPVFDQYPDTRSQVYKGADGEMPTSNAAVDATAGQVLRYQGQIAATYFFSTSGGHTEDIQNVFYGAKPEPYLTGVDDPYDNISPKHRWQIRLTTAGLQHRLGSLVRGKLRGVKVLQRGVSPRIVWAAVVGSRAGHGAEDQARSRRHLGFVQPLLDQAEAERAAHPDHADHSWRRRTGHQCDAPARQAPAPLPEGVPPGQAGAPLRLSLAGAQARTRQGAEAGSRRQLAHRRPHTPKQARPLQRGGKGEGPLPHRCRPDRRSRRPGRLTGNWELGTTE